MNAQDVLKYGHLTVLRSIDGLPEALWTQPNVCGWWSVKEIVNHLASFEYVLVEVLENFLNGAEMPTAQRLQADGARFNDEEVSRRQPMSPAKSLADYEDVQARVAELASRVPAEKFRQAGLLPWYGPEYDLDDFICYTFYGHKREHCAQINVFRDSLK
jgi:hypothetical protein